MTMMPKMQDVLVLTRAGRLTEAVELLRGAPGGRFEAGEPNTIDLAPPTWAGQAWSMPQNAATANAAAAGEASGSFAWREVAVAAGRRRFKLYVPAARSTAPRPLVLMLHGCTQSPDDFAAGTRMNSLADEMGALVAYPEQATSHNQSKCWNWFRPGDQRRGVGEASILAAIVDEVAREHAVDRARVFVAGLSAGGAAAAILAQEYPDVFAAAGVHSGLACGAARDLPSAFAAMKSGAPARQSAMNPVPIITFHGSADRTVVPSNARHVLADVTSDRPATTVERGQAPGGAAYVREVWRGGEGRPRAEAWTIEGAGHAWSGGSPAGSYTDPRGPDASRAMMRFFLDRP